MPEYKVEKLQAVLDSRVNGQKTQMIEQIKEYGVSRFFVDLLDAIESHIVLIDHSNPYLIYTNIAYYYHWRKLSN